jgi:hypothetical protein
MTVDVENLLVKMVTNLDKKVDDITERLTRLEERTSMKATLYGLLGGAVPVLIALAIWWVTTGQD